MATEPELRERYFKSEGIETLSERLKSIYSIYLELPENKYPITFQMFGFPPLVLKSKEECLGNVNELKQILMVEVYDDGEKQ